VGEALALAGGLSLAGRLSMAGGLSHHQTSSSSSLPVACVQATGPLFAERLNYLVIWAKILVIFSLYFSKLFPLKL
jgi:hypothetical protein